MRPQLRILSKATLPLLQEYESIQNRRLEEVGVQASCGKATPCNACCKQLVNVTLGEAAVIAENASSLVRLRRRTLEQQADKLKAIAGGGSFEITKESGPQQLEDFAHAYRRLQMPCAFLEADGRCGIYAYRPLTCREYLVTSDPELCAVLEPAQPLQMVHIENLDNVGTEVRMIIAKELEQQTGPTMRMSPLPVMLAMLAKYL